MEAPETLYRLDGKVALVTGASRGIGAGCARTLARAGARVLLTDVLAEEGQKVVEEIRTLGGEASFAMLDVTREEDWEAGVQTALRQYRRLDVLVNNAGVEIVTPILQTSIEEWRRLHAVNVEGVFLGVKHAMAAMRPGGAAGKGGSIINISSVAGMKGFAFISAYCSSKGAVRLFTKAAAVECAKLGLGIRVNSIHPGFIVTQMADRLFETYGALFFGGDKGKAVEYCTSLTPQGCFGEPADIGAAVLFLASDAARFITGVEFPVDGGLMAQ
jgi:NAD(P)-dependent dehydrogenase (short-subunit alcohol dehydrogenase family)